MSNKVIKKLLQITGEYTNESGEKKKRRIQVGALLQDDKTGRMAIALEVPPIFKPNKDGYMRAYIDCYDIDSTGYHHESPNVEENTRSEQLKTPNSEASKEDEKAFLNQKDINEKNSNNPNLINIDEKKSF